MSHHLDVERILESIARQRVLVVGDVMLDEYMWGEIVRISPEAPVPVMHLHHVESFLGGAANVARNAASLGARVSAVGVVGDDQAATVLFSEFDRVGINRQGVLIDPGRTTTRKCRLMSREHQRQVFRFDQETTGEISPATEARLLSAIREQVSTANAVICSDYLKGVLTNKVLRETSELARERSIPLVTAPKDDHPQKYQGASVLVPNLREFARLAGHQLNGNGHGWMDQAARRLLRGNTFSALLVTRGQDGMTLFEVADGELVRTDVGAITRNVYDVTGAGDTALGVFSLALAAGASRNHAASVANLAAGIVVGMRGTACVTSEDLRRKIYGENESPTSIHASP